MEELYAKDHLGRFQYIDTWIELCNEDGSPAKIRLVTHSDMSVHGIIVL
jgi:hypothetical protein